MSSVLLGGSPYRGEASQEEAPKTPPAPPGSAVAGAGSGQDGQGRGNTLTVIAGVGVLLIAMGVGVLIGRSGDSSAKSSAPPQVITVAPTSTTGASGEASTSTFTSDWPSGTSGYTVQLQKLPQSGTQVSAVEAAKSAATAKGAKNVGALKSEEFSSLPSGGYVIYSGVYHKKSEAEKALPGLKKSFPSASVIDVSNGGSSSSESSSGSSSGKSGVGDSESKPAPPSVVQNLSKKRGQSYEQESKNLPNVISTG
jgi:hypothetical protein